MFLSKSSMYILMKASPITVREFCLRIFSNYKGGRQSERSLSAVGGRKENRKQQVRRLECIRQRLGGLRVRLAEVSSGKWGVRRVVSNAAINKPTACALGMHIFPYSTRALSVRIYPFCLYPTTEQKGLGWLPRQSALEGSRDDYVAPRESRCACKQ